MSLFARMPADFDPERLPGWTLRILSKLDSKLSLIAPEYSILDVDIDEEDSRLVGISLRGLENIESFMLVEDFLFTLNSREELLRQHLSECQDCSADANSTVSAMTEIMLDSASLEDATPGILGMFFEFNQSISSCPFLRLDIDFLKPF
jgi:hypothetical protein